MCTPQFTAALIPGGAAAARTFAADTAGDTRPNRTGAVARPAPTEAPRGLFDRLGLRKVDIAGTRRDQALLLRAGLTKKDADQLAQFANTRGGLDAFESIEAARKAFRESGAFTGRALQPQATAQVSRISTSIRTNQNRVAAPELIGLPLIRTGGN